MTEAAQSADFVHEMIDVRLRGTIALLWVAFVPALSVALLIDLASISTVTVGFSAWSGSFWFSALSPAVSRLC